MRTTPIIMITLTVLLMTTCLQAQEIHEAVAAGDLNKVRELIEANPTLLESKDNDGNTPLIIACLALQSEVANFLIDKGANVKTRGRFQFTTLIWASDVPGQDTVLLQRLIDMGADVNRQGAHGTTALHRAAFRGDPEVARLLLNNGAKVNVPGYNGVTPLHRAAQSGGPEVAKLLVNGGADVNIFDKYSGPVGPEDINGTVLQVAINYNTNEEMAKFLVESGAKLNRRDFNNNTELHLAALKGDAGLVRVLANHGADVNAVNEYHHTALYYAAKHGYRSIAMELIAAGADKNTIVEVNYGKAPQLTETLKKGEAYLWHLGYSFAVKTMKNLLIFTNINHKISESPEAGLANGNLNPNELEGQKITLLVSHRDRYQMRTEDFIQLANLVPDITIVSSFKPDFSSEENQEIPAYRFAAPNESFSMDGIQVHTIQALGGGMGYLVESDGVKVLHAGFHVSDNEASNVEKYRKEIDYLTAFGPIDIAILSVYGHNNRIGTAFEPHLYLLDQLSPKVVYLFGANIPEQYPACTEVLRVRNIPVIFPEIKQAVGERFHYVSDRQEVF